MTGFFDRLPTWLQHTIVAAAALLSLAGLDWLQANYTTWNLAPELNGLLAILVPLTIGYVTPFTQKYGVGKVAPVVAPIDPTGGTGQ